MIQDFPKQKNEKLFHRFCSEVKSEQKNINDIDCVKVNIQSISKDEASNKQEVKNVRAI